MPSNRTIGIVVAGLVLALVLAAFVSPFASSHPDGLEWVAEEQGFMEKAEATPPAWKASPMPDYEVPAVEGAFSGPLAGIFGTLITFAVGVGLVWIVRRGRPSATPPEQPSA